MQRSGLYMSILAGLVLSPVASAQLPLNATPTQTATPELGGEATIDVITVGQGAMGIPLRHGGVLPGTERVEFRGKTLKRGEDYQIDAESGVIYLMRATKPGDVVRVAYRWDKQREEKATKAQASNGIAPYKFNIGQGNDVMLGFGMTERLADGNVVQSNLFGWKNAMKFGSVSTNGTLLFGQRDKVNASSDYEFQKDPGQTETGSSHFYMQNLAMSLGGGQIEVNYQDISKNFAGFGAAQNAGYSAETINQLKKERGLERFGMSMKDVGMGGLKFSNSFKRVGDDKDAIDWRTFGFNGGGFSFQYNSQKVGENFKRFGDLAEGNRGQLQKEVGMERESYAMQFAQKSSKLTFNMQRVEDPKSGGIERREFGLDTTNLKMNFGEQEVEQDFRRMNSLMDQERAMWGRELGMHRQWFSMQSNVFGAGQPLSFSQSSLSDGEKAYNAQDVLAKGNGWSLEHISRDSDEGFNRFGAMQDGERNDHINSIGRMYDPKGLPFRGEEVHWFNQSAGIGRSVTRFQGMPYKGWNVTFDHLDLKGVNDGASVDTLNLQGKGFQLSFRKQELGDDFTELGRLLELERWRLGGIVGLDKTDMSMNFNLSSNRSFLYSSMSANAGGKGAGRTLVNYKDPNLNVSVATRHVDQGFTNVNQLVDPEKDLFGTLVGFRQTDVRANWTINKDLRLSMVSVNSASETLSEKRFMEDYSLSWSPSANTAFMVRHMTSNHEDPLSTLFSQTIDHMSLTQKFGKYGTLKFIQESQEFEGTQATAPSWHRTYFGYETKLNTKTSLMAETSKTRFDDGEKEDINSSTVSTELNPRVGVSVSNTSIDRSGDGRDEKKRGYGFWYDFGNGMRLVYGFAQHRAGELAPDTNNQSATLSGGQVGNVAVTNGQYAINQWEGNRTQAMGGVGLSTVKPMTFFGLTNLKINANLDTASDRQVWLKQNQYFGMSANLGSNGIGFEYRSQIAPNGFRGIDRGVTFTTDQSEKKNLRVNLKYKERTTPFGEKIVIRDYSIVAKPMKGVEVSHHVLTHPEVARGDVILGSIATPRRVNQWKLDVKATEDTTVGAQWEEQFDQNRPMTRLGGVNVSLFKKSGSPVNLFYGVEQSDANNDRKTQQRYHLRFDQRPGPNQQFSFFIGNLNNTHGLQTNQKRNNLSLQVDYQIKF